MSADPPWLVRVKEKLGLRDDEDRLASLARYDAEELEELRKPMWLLEGCHEGKDDYGTTIWHRAFRGSLHEAKTYVENLERNGDYDATYVYLTLMAPGAILRSQYLYKYESYHHANKAGTWSAQ